MTLTNEQLMELSKAVNFRLKEFECSMSMPSLGVIRLTVDLYRELWPQPDTDAAYDNGYDAGYAEAKRVYQLGYGDGKTMAPDPSPNGTEIYHALEERAQDAARSDEPSPIFVPDDDPYNITAMFSEKPDAPPIPTPQAPMGVVTPPNKPIGAGRFLTLPHPDEARANIANALGVGNVEFDYTPRPTNGQPKPKAKHKPILPGEHAKPVNKRGNVLPTLDEVVGLLKEIAMGGVMPTMDAFNVARPGNWATAWAHMQRLGVTWPELAREAGLTLRQKAGSQKEVFDATIQE